jgi:leader peptidase (prepilin peptidase)/N-methyltransferase
MWPTLTDTTLWPLAAGLFGLCIGSFLNVLIYRLPRMMEAAWAANNGDTGATRTAEPFNLMHPPSRCPACGHRIAAWENIPVLSWLLLRGKCSECKAPISSRYPLVELLTAGLSALAAWHFGPNLHGVLAIGMTWWLVPLFFIDLDTRLLPDVLTLSLLVFGLGLNALGAAVPLVDALIGAMAGYGVFWIIFQLFRLATGKEGMGYGDFKLLAALGACMGWQMLPQIIFVSAVSGVLLGVPLMKARPGQAIPYGPWLVLAGLVALYFGPQINQWYLRFSGLS